MRATAGVASNVVIFYDRGTGQWWTAAAGLSQARWGLVATSVGTVAIFAGGITGKLLSIMLFVCCVRDF